MPFALHKHYETPLSRPEMEAWLAALAQRETGFWLLKAPLYDVSYSADTFSIQRRSRGRNQPWYPRIRGRLVAGVPVRVTLTIKPNYLLLAFSAVFIGVFISAIWLIEGPTSNGERLLSSLFALSVAGFIAYFNALKPVPDAEAWLVRKLWLVEVPAPANEPSGSRQSM
jgi:hypothetical protein